MVVVVAVVPVLEEPVAETSLASWAKGSRSGSVCTGRLSGAGVAFGVAEAFGTTTTWCVGTEIAVLEDEELGFSAK